MSMLSKNLEKSLHRAFALAGERRHEYATLEHLLLAMTEDEDATPVLKACGVDVDRLRHDLESFIDNRLKGIVTQTPSEPLPTAGFQRVVQRAAVHVQSSGRKEVTGANVLVALFSERDSHAVSFLENQGMSRLDAVDYISHGKAKVPGRARTRRVTGSEEESGGESTVKQGNEALEKDAGNGSENNREAGSVKDSFDKVIKEFRDLTSAFDELVASGTASADRLSEMRDEAAAKMDEARDIASHMSRNALQQTRYAAAKAGDYVRENPLSSAAIAAGIGLVAGLLIHRDRR